MRVVLEGEWTKARQDTEEICCWDTQGRLDSVQMSNSAFLVFVRVLGHFRNKWGKYQRSEKVVWFGGNSVTREGEGAGHELCQQQK